MTRRKAIWLAVAIGATLLLLLCLRLWFTATDPRAGIQEGMSVTEVQELLGPPFWVNKEEAGYHWGWKTENGTIWVYFEQRGVASKHFTPISPPEWLNRLSTWLGW